MPHCADVTLLFVILLPLIVVNAYFCLELLYGLRAPGVWRHPERSSPDRTVIIIPAHDEARIIAETIAALQSELPTGFRLLVVADNCHDETAAIARHAGVIVIERRDDRNRGKGFALAYARDHLRSDPPHVVMIVDADCRMDRTSLTNLAAAATGRPAQAINLLRPDLSAEPMVQVSNFAFMIKNRIRQGGLSELADAVHLTGTGMAFPWPLFRDAPLATSSIVEDLKLGIDFARQGHAPILARNATVWSSASTSSGTLTQRTRWEGGFLSTSATVVAPLLLEGARRLRGQLVILGLNLAVPPLTLLVLANLIVLSAGSLATLLWAGSPWPIAALLLTMVLGALLLVVAWVRVGRAFLSPRAAMRLPFYLIWKLPVYMRMIRRSQRSWLRTGRG
jgi:cellulose synthase/poly-beta-1,6-N-acetylglucosamine synthase-like glycosyltransferase